MPSNIGAITERRSKIYFVPYSQSYREKNIEKKTYLIPPHPTLSS